VTGDRGEGATLTKVVGQEQVHNQDSVGILYREVMAKQSGLMKVVDAVLYLYYRAFHSWHDQLDQTHTYMLLLYSCLLLCQNYKMMHVEAAENMRTDFVDHQAQA
jgi:hypothetical protein